MSRLARTARPDRVWACFVSRSARGPSKNLRCSWRATLTSFVDVRHVDSCGPCLHSALISQPITQQTLRDLPNIAGKELEGTCPVCRHPLSGGWGKSLRGAILRMAEVEMPC
jgi:hypothetical protein